MLFSASLATCYVAAFFCCAQDAGIMLSSKCPFSGVGSWNTARKHVPKIITTPVATQPLIVYLQFQNHGNILITCMHNALQEAGPVHAPIPAVIMQLITIHDRQPTEYALWFFKLTIFSSGKFTFVPVCNAMKRSRADGK
jgi:hypothetical protein